MPETKGDRTPPALARARQLAERSAVDLRLLGDATRAAGLPFKALARIQRARREMKDLLVELSAGGGGKPR